MSQNCRYCGFDIYGTCPPAAPAPPRSPPTAPTVTGDPHITAFESDKFDFHGKDGVLYNLLSAKNASINARIEYHTFNKFDLRIHGSFFTAMYFTVRSLVTGKIHTIEYDPHHPPVKVDNLPFAVGATATLDDISVRLPNINSLMVETYQWLFKVSAREIKYGVLKERYLRDKPDQLDLSIIPLKDPLKYGIAPHGLIGQTADGDHVAVDGAQDDLKALSKDAERGPGGLKLVYPSANAEGAIEGSAEDYEVASKFTTEFKYSRFDASSAPTRNVNALTGKKRYDIVSQGAQTTSDDAIDDTALS